MPNSLLDSCIHIDEERVSRRRIVPRRVRFELNREILAQIEQAQESDTKIVLSANKLTNLRYYALLACHFEERSPLLFSTNFSDGYSQNQQSVTVVRSVIDLEGKIAQQIQRDLWQNPQLLPSVIKAHHWLIGQILAQLPLKTKNYSQKLSWALWLVTASLATLFIWYFLPVNYLIKLLVTFLVFGILKIATKNLIAAQLRRLILRQLLSGLLTNKVDRRRLGFKLLGILG
jgi:hypothetical protein